MSKGVGIDEKIDWQVLAIATQITALIGRNGKPLTKRADYVRRIYETLRECGDNAVAILDLIQALARDESSRPSKKPNRQKRSPF